MMIRKLKSRKMEFKGFVSMRTLNGDLLDVESVI